MNYIFNSLGSNYTFSFVLYSLFQLFNIRDSNSVTILEKKLEKIYGGKIFTFYKGRHAIEFSLQSLGIGKKDKVLTQAFTCFAVEEGIVKSGAEPVFVDVEKYKLNLSVKTLDRAHRQHKDIKAVLVQHTLGVPAEIKAIRNWCDEKGLILIEDLAHSYGVVEDGGKPFGDLADVVVLSFGRDKMLDAVSGGACIFKIKTHNSKEEYLKVKNHIPFNQNVSDLLYPLFTWIIRKTYFLGFGKILHFVLRSLGFFKSSVDSSIIQLTKLPMQHASLVNYQLSNFEKQHIHRNRITRIYSSALSKVKKYLNSDFKNSSPLRFPLIVENPNQIVECMKNNKIYLADRWYKSPVECDSTGRVSSYKEGECPQAEHLSKHLINLPVHINVSKKQAENIMKSLKPCLN